MMVNRRKGFHHKGFWLENQKEISDLSDALQNGDNEEISKIMYRIYSRGDVEL